MADVTQRFERGESCTRTPSVRLAADDQRDTIRRLRSYGSCPCSITHAFYSVGALIANDGARADFNGDEGLEIHRKDGRQSPLIAAACVDAVPASRAEPGARSKTNGQRVRLYGGHADEIPCGVAAPEPADHRNTIEQTHASTIPSSSSAGSGLKVTNRGEWT